MPALDVTYDYYVQSYGGIAIAESVWLRYVSQAQAYLNRIESLSYVAPYGDDEERAWSMATCAVAEVYHAYDKATGVGSEHAPVSSMSIGSVSTSYDTSFGAGFDGGAQSLDVRLHDAASRYLHVYMGVDLL